MATNKKNELKKQKAKLLQMTEEAEALLKEPLPLASVVAVTELTDISAKESPQELATVETGGAKRYVSVPGDTFHEGDLCVLFATNACVKGAPVYEKWRGTQSIDVNFDFDEFGVKVTYVALKGSKQHFRFNPGILIPIGELPAVAGRGVGEDVSEALGVCLHDDVRRRERERLVAEQAEKKLRRKDIKLMERYYRARDWRAHCVTGFLGKAPSFVKVSHFDNLVDHPEYFDRYGDMLFDVTEKYNGLNLTVYYSPDTDDGVHVCRNGQELVPDDDNYFWHVIRQQGVDRELMDMGYAVSLEGVVTGPSVRGGLIEGRLHERFCVFDIFDIEENRILCSDERYSYCREANLPHVQLVAKDFPLFEKAPTLPPLLSTAARPNSRGGIRYGLVFRASGDDEDVSFQLPNPEYKPSILQLKVDSNFEAD